MKKLFIALLFLTAANATAAGLARRVTQATRAQKPEIVVFMTAQKAAKQANLALGIAKDNMNKAQHAALMSEIAYTNSKKALRHANLMLDIARENIKKAGQKATGNNWVSRTASTLNSK